MDTDGYPNAATEKDVQGDSNAKVGLAATSVPTLDLNAAIVLDAAVDLEITELPRALNLDAVAELGTDFATGVDSDMMVGLDTTENSVEAQASAVSGMVAHSDITVDLEANAESEELTPLGFGLVSSRSVSTWPPAQPQAAQPISDQQREINARTAQGKLLYDTLSPAKKIELDRILQSSADLKRVDIPEIFGHLTEASMVKERGEPGIYHEGNEYTLDVQNVPAGVDTVILGTMLRKVDPHTVVDLEADVSSATSVGSDVNDDVDSNAAVQSDAGSSLDAPYRFGRCLGRRLRTYYRFRSCCRLECIGRLGKRC